MLKYFMMALVAGILAMPFVVQADQRMETWQGLCHFALDPADDDNEVYFANCKNTIDTPDTGDGTGRKANGMSIVKAKYDIFGRAYPNYRNLKLAGPENTRYDYFNTAERAVIETPCVMVTSNYNAANDDNNETVYITNDWTVDIEYTNIEFDNFTFDIVYTLSCRNGVAQ